MKNKRWIWPLWSGLVLAFVLHVSAQIEITSYDGTGTLEWSHSLSNAQSFSVEWTGALTSGVWKGSWENLADIPATASTYRVSVPSCYRVVAYTNVLQSRWTILYYMMADNNLEPDFLSKFNKLAVRSSDTNVQMVVQLARMGSDTNYDSWSGVERFYITNGITPVQTNAIQDWGDGKGGRMLNMSDPSNLADFLDWGMRLFPADHTALVIGDHGFGWTGFGICESYSDSYMYLGDLRSVLENTPQQVDSLFLDACMMCMADTAAEVAGTDVRTLMASETFGQCDWPYGWLLEGLHANPSWTPVQFAGDWTDRLWTYYSVSNPVASITLCALDLEAIPGVVSNTRVFVSGILDTNVTFAEVQTRSRTLMTSISNSMIACHLGTNWDGIANGISVNFPLKDGLYLPPLFAEYMPRRTLFSGEAQWRSLLAAFYDPMSYPPYHSQLNTVRNAITNYLDGEGESYIDWIDFLGRIADASP